MLLPQETLDAGIRISFSLLFFLLPYLKKEKGCRVTPHSSKLPSFLRKPIWSGDKDWWVFKPSQFQVWLSSFALWSKRNNLNALTSAPATPSPPPRNNHRLGSSNPLFQAINTCLFCVCWDRRRLLALPKKACWRASATDCLHNINTRKIPKKMTRAWHLKNYPIAFGYNWKSLAARPKIYLVKYNFVGQLKK